MKAILKITVVKEIDKDDKELYKEFISEGDMQAIYENFDPECEGQHAIEFKE